MMMITDQKREAAVVKETGRIEAFSDGVFAVAITLLVFGLKVPPLSPETFTVGGLALALFKEWPSYLIFITSFATILIMWQGHHSIFKLVHRSDSPFLFANGFLLLLVTLVPFPTSLMAQYLTTPVAAVTCAVYSGVFVVINVAYNLLWWSAAHRHRLLKSGVSPAQVKSVTRKLLIGFPLYLLATLLAFWNPYVSLGICSVLWIFWAFSFYERY